MVSPPPTLVRFLLAGTVAMVCRTPVFAAETGTGPSPPPNIILIFADDLGYGDIGCFRRASSVGGPSDHDAATAVMPSSPSPRIDRLASEGILFRDFVVSSAVCSASRAALLTGCLHRRVSIAGALGPKSDHGLHPSERTIAEVCRQRGYATACFGKWHLGHDPTFLPPVQGFDQYLGIPYSNDMWPLHPSTVAARRVNSAAKSRWPELPMIAATRTPDGTADYRIINPEMTPADQRRMTGQFTDAAIDFLRSHGDVPVFIYLAHPMPHVPLHVSDEFRGRTGRGLFADVIAEIDDSVGRLVDAADALSRHPPSSSHPPSSPQTTLSKPPATADPDRPSSRRETLFIFASDNGPWLSYGTHAGSAGPLREGKGTMFEGGARVPAVMRWTGVIPRGIETELLCSTIDVLPTIEAIVSSGDAPVHRDVPDGDFRSDRPIDGVDLGPVLRGEPPPPQLADRFIPGYYQGQLQTIRNDRFKYVFDHRYRTLDGHPGGDYGRPVAYQHTQSGEALYDLDRDRGETTDVSAENPEVVQRLRAAAERYRETLGDKLTDRTGSEVRPPGRLKPADERLPLLWP